MRASQLKYGLLLFCVSVFVAVFVVGCTSEQDKQDLRAVRRVKIKQIGLKDNSATNAPAMQKSAVASKAVQDNVAAVVKKPVPTDNTPRITSTYNALGKRDPFIPFLKGEDKISKAELDRLPPLQRYEIADLKLVGVLWGKKGYKALVEDNEGKGYSVVVGTKVGRNRGVAVKIDTTSVQIREEFTDYVGSTIVKESELTLPSNAGGK